MALTNLGQYGFAGNAPVSSLNYGSNPMQQSNGNPFAANSQEFQQYNETYGRTPQSQGGGLDDLTYNTNQLTAAHAAANAPAIAAYQASIPNVQQQFANAKTDITNTRDLLGKQYQDLLQNISQRETGAKTAAAQEFGKRGVSLQSGAYDQYVDKNVTQPYTGQYNQAHTTNQASQAALTSAFNQNSTGETSAELAINQAIANLQSGGSSDAIAQALGLTQSNQSNALAQQYYSLDKSKTDLANQLSQYNLNQYTNPQSTYNALQSAELQGQLLKNATGQQSYDFNSQSNPLAIQAAQAALQKQLNPSPVANSQGYLPQNQVAQVNQQQAAMDPQLQAALEFYQRQMNGDPYYSLPAVNGGSGSNPTVLNFNGLEGLNFNGAALGLGK